MADQGVKKLTMWTDTETVALLLAVIDRQGLGTIKWKDLRVPEGRTIKSCMHRMDKLRAEVKNGAIALSAPEPSTPRKEAEKRKCPKLAPADDGEDDEEVPRETGSPTKQGRKRGAKVKEEDGHDDGEEVKVTPKKRQSAVQASKSSTKKVKREEANKAGYEE